MSRSARVTTTTAIENHFFSRPATTTTTDNSATTHALTEPLNNDHNTHHTQAQEEFPSHRATKRRKLEIRGPKQQTLDAFFSNVPPASVSVTIATTSTSSNGLLVDTIGDVQREVSATPTTPESNDTHEQQPHETRASKKVVKITQIQDKKQEEKRTLRSQDDGPRLKSELATYFNNYEEIMFDIPQEVELLDIETTLYITDDAVKAGLTASPAKSSKSSNTRRRQLKALDIKPQAQLLSIDVVSRPLVEQADPLTDEVFIVSHRRAERKEKQMRNIEREHAMHEKVQLERLLDGLLGHDWLRVLGITGITDSESKRYEEKRDYFISEVRTLVNKFNQWKEEEKRQKLEKEALLAAEKELEEGDDDTEVSSVDPPSSDLNRSASRQLQQETASAMKQQVRRKERSSNVHTAIPAEVPYRPPSPITSFYPSRHLRESALKKARNSRNTLAFGLPLPDMDEEDFALPEHYLTAEVLRATARERRRKNRESVANAASKPP